MPYSRDRLEAQGIILLPDCTNHRPGCTPASLRPYRHLVVELSPAIRAYAVREFRA